MSDAGYAGSSGNNAADADGQSQDSAAKGKKKGGPPPFAVGKGTAVLRAYIEHAAAEASGAAQQNGASAAAAQPGAAWPSVAMMHTAVNRALRADRSGSMLDEVRCADDARCCNMCCGGLLILASRVEHVYNFSSLYVI